MPRKTSEPKRDCIIIRVTEETKARIARYASRRNLTMTEIILEHLEKLIAADDQTRPTRRTLFTRPS